MRGCRGRIRTFGTLPANALLLANAADRCKYNMLFLDLSKRINHLI